MHLQTILEGRETFTAALKKVPHSEIKWLYQKQAKAIELLSNEAHDLNSWFNFICESSITKKYWKGENYRPHVLMSKFFEVDKEMCGIMFRDLNTETISVEGRIDRFGFYAEQMLKKIRRSNPDERETNHFQTGPMISYYLTMTFPSNYAIYRHDLFIRTLELLKVAEIPSVEDSPRYYKICRTLGTILRKSEALVEIQEERLKLMQVPDLNSKLFVFEFLHHLAKVAYYK